MEFTDINHDLERLLKENLDDKVWSWLMAKLKLITASNATKELYLTYTLLASKVDKRDSLRYTSNNMVLENYLREQSAGLLEVSRIYLLSKVLRNDEPFFRSKVANLIQVADTSELETFLKFLVLLPNAENYKNSAVEALRTNISTVFDAISLNNPYPGDYFNDQQWNQMYLKAAFMQRDLSSIMDVDRRANSDLARIISDYAHERWAASRHVDPLFWRPVTKFLNDNLLKDMERLLNSDDPRENGAGALCCYFSDDKKAKNLLKKYPELEDQVASGKMTWENLKH
ncbi:EboA domain-containing protein [Pareuzebyella sediminis]|uniref:EboA domain-containing protein n=1 Tax=Pareuzebyella sediminis TaxID=2607998 RepID=UPI0011EC6699|nr:EboA domain-containing protein [Pareuzebyella sediminis]